MGQHGMVVLGNQLFSPDLLPPQRDCRIYMAEDWGLCTYVRHHRQKIVLFLAAMRSYRDQLRGAGFEVDYTPLPLPDPGKEGGSRSVELPATPPPLSYEDGLTRWVRQHGIDHLTLWQVEDKFFESRLIAWASQQRVTIEWLESPMFLTSRQDADRWLSQHRPRMAEFYKWQRRRLEIMIDDQGQPEGGRWSFDEENRRPLPKRMALPQPPRTEPTEHVRELIAQLQESFHDHPGALHSEAWWLPTTHAEADRWLQQFLAVRFEQFGPYEDALSVRDPFLFHSVLAVPLNLGLLTPRQVLHRVLDWSQRHSVPINSLEGFVRQIIGWREFIRGVYRRHSDQQESRNFFDHHRRLTDDWWQATTGIVPVDTMIERLQTYGWCHHIERLMVAGSMFCLCEIEPTEVHRWFMEMFVDSSDWVMGPNVYGMALFADGGIFSTKPYICGSNYWLKMGDYPKPRSGEHVPGTSATWTECVDGLYWRFVDKHRDFLIGSARLSQIVRLLDRMPAARRQHIFGAAEDFLGRYTLPDRAGA